MIEGQHNGRCVFDLDTETCKPHAFVVAALEADQVHHDGRSELPLSSKSELNNQCDTVNQEVF